MAAGRSRGTGGGPTGRVQSVERAIELLGSIGAAGEEGLTVAEAADRCGLNRATAWRLLATLEHHEYVRRDPDSGRYRIGVGVERLVGGTEADRLIARCHPLLEKLSEWTGETASLALPLPEGLTYVDEVVPESLVIVRWAGRRVSLHATSAGKAMLAWMPEADVAAVLDAPLTGHTGATHTDGRALEEELRSIRELGYSRADGELETGVHGVSAAIRDEAGRPIGIISVWGAGRPRTEAQFAELGALVVAAAAELSGRE